LPVTVPGGTITGWHQGEDPDVRLFHGGPGVSDYTESLAAELEDVYTVDYLRDEPGWRGLLRVEVDWPPGPPVVSLN
jgi:hypothetical protein